MQHAGNLDVEVESFGADPERKIVGEAATVVGDRRGQIDRHRLGWGDRAPRLGVIGGSPVPELLIEHTFDYVLW